MSLKSSPLVCFVISMIIGVCAAPSVFASRDKAGNGGGGLLCGNRAQLYDLFEGGRYFGLSFSPIPGTTENEYVEKALAKLLSSYDLSRRFEIRRDFRRFQTEYRSKLKPTSDRLALTPDADRFEIPEGCEPVQLATWNDRLDQIRYQEKLYALLPTFDRAALEVHEVLYKIGRDRGVAPDSNNTRLLVAQLMSTWTGPLESSSLYPHLAEVTACHPGQLIITDESWTYCRRTQSEAAEGNLNFKISIPLMEEFLAEYRAQRGLASSGSSHTVRKAARRRSEELNSQWFAINRYLRSIGVHSVPAQIWKSKAAVAFYLDATDLTGSDTQDISEDTDTIFMFRIGSPEPHLSYSTSKRETLHPFTRSLMEGPLQLEAKIWEKFTREADAIPVSFLLPVTPYAVFRFFKLQENPSVVTN